MFSLDPKVPHNITLFFEKMLTAAGYAATSTEYYRDLWKLLFYFCLVIIFFVLIAIFYVYYEGWTVNETLFFMIFTLSTVGYGTPSPTDDYSRLFTIFFIIICIGIIFSGISDLIHNHITWLQTVCCKSSSQQVAEDIVIGDIYHYRKQLVWYLMILLSWIMIGSVVLKYNEEWTWVTAIYYMVQTTTVRPSCH